MKKTVLFILILLIGFGGWYAWDRLQDAKAGESVTEPSEAGQSEADQPGAEKTAALCLSYPEVKSATVRITKPAAALRWENIAVEIERSR